MKANSPLTTAFDVKTFAGGFRNQNLCIPFYDLKLVGPEGSFEAKGLLVSRGDKLFIEHSPIPFDGSSVPKTRSEGVFGPANWWRAEGVTIHGLHIHAEDLLPPSHNWKISNGHIHYCTKVRRLRVAKDNISISEKTTAKAPSKNLWFRASLADAKLDLHNELQKYEERNPFFEGLIYHSWSEGTWIGEIPGWRFCFRTEGDDMFVHLETKDEFDPEVDLKAAHRLTGLLHALSFMQAGEVIPWRVQHSEDSKSDPDVFLLHFKNPFTHKTPIGGPMLHQPEFVMKMFTCMADYFATENPHMDQMRQFLWQLNQSGHGTDIRLGGSMHLCAIFEGMCNEMLLTKCGWSKTKLGKKNALERFRELSDALALQWDGQFDRVVKIWKSLRDDLAHGNFFGLKGAWDGDLFTLNSLVTAGIQALFLKDAEWPEPIDFGLLGPTSHLYYQ